MGPVELTLFFQQDLDFDIILMVSGCHAEHLEGSGVNHRLQRVPLAAGSLVQLTFRVVASSYCTEGSFSLFVLSRFATFCPWGLYIG